MICRFVKHRINFLAFFLTFFLTPAISLADDIWNFGRNSCRLHLAGTYLTTIKNSQGGFNSRSVLTIHQDGTISAADSGQFEFKFGQQMGAYRCLGISKAKGITLDFGETESIEDIDIAKSDWIFKKMKDGSLSGEITVNLYTPLETCDPLGDPENSCIKDPAGTFTFTSVKVRP